MNMGRPSWHAVQAKSKVGVPQVSHIHSPQYFCVFMLWFLGRCMLCVWFLCVHRSEGRWVHCNFRMKG